MANTDKFLAGKAIGTVKGINGEAIAIDAKGVKRILHAGDKVFPDEVIQTQNGVTVQIEFTNGGFATVGGGDTLALDHTTVADAGAAPKVAPLPSAAEIESLQKMIVQGKDPSDAGESAAAGQASGGGAEEGSSFVIVEQNAARGEVTPGFDTTTFSSAQPSDVIETAYYALETDEQPTPPGKEALNDYNQRMVMYVDKEQAGDSMIGQAQFNKNQGVQDGTSPSSENGFGNVTVGTDKKLTYFLSEEGEKALAESADGYIIDYVTYTGADGKEYTVQVIITKDPDFHTNALEFGGEIRHETHYSYMDDSQYKVQSSSGDDVLEFSRVGKESHIHTGLGDDEIHITQGLFGNSTINVSVGDNKVFVSADRAANQSIAMDDSHIIGGKGKTDIRIDASNDQGAAFGMAGSSTIDNAGTGKIEINIKPGSRVDWSQPSPTGHGMHAKGESDSRGLPFTNTEHNRITSKGDVEINVNGTDENDTNTAMYAIKGGSNTIKTEGNFSAHVNGGRYDTCGMYTDAGLNTIEAKKVDIFVGYENAEGIIQEKNNTQSGAILKVSGREANYLSEVKSENRIISETDINLKGRAKGSLTGMEASGLYDSTNISSNYLEAKTGSITLDVQTHSGEARGLNTTMVGKNTLKASGDISVKVQGGTNVFGIDNASGTNSLFAGRDITFDITARSDAEKISAMGIAHTYRGDQNTIENKGTLKIGVHTENTDYDGQKQLAKGMHTSKSGENLVKTGQLDMTVKTEGKGLAGEQLAYGLSAGYDQDQDYKGTSLNHIILTGDKNSTSKIHVEAKNKDNGNTDPDNAQYAYGMYTHSTDDCGRYSSEQYAKNIIEGETGMMAKGSLEMTVSADSKNGNATGMYAGVSKSGFSSGPNDEYDATNIIRSEKVKMQVSSEGAAYGMRAGSDLDHTEQGNGTAEMHQGENLIETRDLEMTVKGKGVSDAMLAENGGKNTIRYDGKENATYNITGNIRSDGESKNLIKTGSGDDSITINGSVSGVRGGTPDSYTWSNDIDTGSGNDTIRIEFNAPDKSNSPALWGTRINAGDGNNTVSVKAKVSEGTVWGMYNSDIHTGSGTQNISVDAHSENGWALGISNSTIQIGDGDNSQILIRAQSQSGNVRGVTDESRIILGDGKNNTVDIQSHVKEKGDAYGLYESSIEAGKGQYKITIEASNQDGQLSAMTSMDGSKESLIRIEESQGSNIRVAAENQGDTWISGMYGNARIDIQTGSHNTIDVSATSDGSGETYGMFGAQDHGYANIHVGDGDHNTILISAKNTGTGNSYGMYDRDIDSKHTTVQIGSGSHNDIQITAEAKSGWARGLGYGSQVIIDDAKGTTEGNTLKIQTSSEEDYAIGMDTKSRLHVGSDNRYDIEIAARSAGDGCAIGMDESSITIEKGANHLKLSATGEAGSMTGVSHSTITSGKEGKNETSHNTVEISARATSGRAVGSTASQIKLHGSNDKLIMKAHSESDTAIGMLSENSMKNGLKAGQVEIHASGDTTYGMQASSRAENIIEARDLILDAGEGYAMYAQKGGGNSILYEGSENATFKITGDIYADSNINSKNTIKTGDGNDTILIEGDIKGGTSTGNGAENSPYHYSNKIDTGGGDDSITIKGKVSYADIFSGDGEDTIRIDGDVDHAHVDAGKGNDHVWINGQVTDTWLDGGQGWDTLHLKGENHLNDFNKNGNSIRGFEEIDMSGNNSNDILRIGDVLEGFSSIKDTEGWSSVDQNLLDQLSNNDSRVLCVSGDKDDSVLFENNGNWENAGQVTRDGANYDVYKNSNGDFVLIDESMNNNQIGF